MIDRIVFMGFIFIEYRKSSQNAIHIESLCIAVVLHPRRSGIFDILIM